MIAIYCLQSEEEQASVRQNLLLEGIPAVLCGPDRENNSMIEKMPFVYFTKAALVFGRRLKEKLSPASLIELSEDASPLSLVAAVQNAYRYQSGQDYWEGFAKNIRFFGWDVFYRGSLMGFTQSEYRILRLLFHSRDVYFTAEEIEAACLVAKLGSASVHICNMNRKARDATGRPIVETKRYKGYRLV